VYEEEFGHGWAKMNEPFFIYSGQKGVGVYKKWPDSIIPLSD